MKFKKTQIYCAIMAVILIGWGLLQQGKWDKYYKNKLSQPPRQIVTKALNLFDKPGKAIDLGAGAGNETVLMANSGWCVWAIDGEPKAIKIISQRNDLKDPRKIFAKVAKFEEDSTWDALPQVDFVNASYALPFCDRVNFKKVWIHITNKLNPGGRFAGHFFGLNFQGFNDQEMKHMTFLTKDEVLSLFQGFDIELFQEIEEDGKSGTGKPTHSHVFEVIAQKTKNAKEDS